MTPEKQRSEIAKLCDWKPDLICTDLDGNPWPSDPPDYLNDLNACHEFEKTLGDIDNWLLYDKALAEITEGFTFHATAAQRCEAFLKVFDKWESQP